MIVRGEPSSQNWFQFANHYGGAPVVMLFQVDQGPVVKNVVGHRLAARPPRLGVRPLRIISRLVKPRKLAQRESIIIEKHRRDRILCLASPADLNGAPEEFLRLEGLTDRLERQGPVVK